MRHLKTLLGHSRTLVAYVCIFMRAHSLKALPAVMQKRHHQWNWSFCVFLPQLKAHCRCRCCCCSFVGHLVEHLVCQLAGWLTGRVACLTQLLLSVTGSNYVRWRAVFSSCWLLAVGFWVDTGLGWARRGQLLFALLVSMAADVEVFCLMLMLQPLLYLQGWPDDPFARPPVRRFVRL